MSMYSEFQYFLAEHVSSDGLPDDLDTWSTEALQKLIQYAQLELDRRITSSAGTGNTREGL